MGNRLKRAFSHNEPESYKGQLRFTNGEVYEDFLKKLDEMHITGVPVEIDGVESVEMNQIIDGATYPMHNHDGITKFFLMPHQEPVSIDTPTEYGNFTWNLNRIKLRDRIVLSNSNKSIIAIKITAFLENSTMQVSFNSNPQYADSISEIIVWTSAVLALLVRFFSKRPSELEHIASQLEHELGLWRRIQAIEELLYISFVPNKIDFETIDETIRDLELIHMQIVKKEIVRENKGLTSLKATLTPDGDTSIVIPVEGNDLALLFSENRKMNIWGVEIETFSVCVAFNHIVDTIEEDDDSDAALIVFREKESNPRYISTRSFISESERDSESKRLSMNFSEVVKEYQNAKTLQTLYEEMVSE